MYIILKNEIGGDTEGVILAAGRDVMRVCVRELSDTLELRFSDGAWGAVGGKKFEIGALVAETEHAMSELGNALRAQTFTAGMQFFG
ncbi:MAG: hypothetical protein WBY44_05060 [Bryobacteraceae bacterium]